MSNSTIEAALRAANVSVSRQDIVVDPPTAYGSPPTTGYSDDPINTATGNVIENEVDLGFTGATLRLAKARAVINDAVERVYGEDTVETVGEEIVYWTDLHADL